MPNTKISDDSSSHHSWPRIDPIGILIAPGIRLRLLTAVITGIGTCAAVPAYAERPGLRELKWLHPGADVVAALTQAPAECLTIPSDVRRAERVRLGRVAFQSPVLLGGIASRIGLSCDSCHRNGHDNPDFFVAGVSSEPGTADVTGSVFSTTRDDHVENPVPIPTLLDASSRPPFGTVVPAGDLRTFLHAAIVDEFEGQEPAPTVLEALEAYLGELKSSACPKTMLVKVRFESDARRLLQIFDVVVSAFEREDLRGGEFALLSLRVALGRVHDRFSESVTDRDELVASSRFLAQIREEIGKGGKRVKAIVQRLASERKRLEDRLERLRNQTVHSFYDEDFIRRRVGTAMKADPERTGHD